MFNLFSSVFNVFPSTWGGSSSSTYGTKGNDTFHGTSGNDKYDGKDGNDTIFGNGGNDKLDGGDGHDNINGGEGCDEVDGGCGNDTLDGGAGSDKVDGDDGDDTLIYTMGENKNASDHYDGGCGCDTLVLHLTKAEFMRSDVQSDIARFQHYLNDPWNKKSSYCNEFEFKAFCLEVERIEKLVVKVDGVIIDPKDEGIDAINDRFNAVENGGQISGNVIANDIAPDFIKTIELRSTPAAGVFNFDATNGTFTFDPGTAFEYLGEGHTATVSFDYRITDSDGDQDTARVDIVVTGKNDAAVIGNPTNGAVTEDANVTTNGKLTVSGTISVSDVDQGQSYFVSHSGATGNLGTLAFVPNGSYTYSVDNSAVQYLGAGQTKTDTFTVVSADGTSKQVQFVINGVNDAAIIGNPVPNAVTEDANVNNGKISVSGVISVSDVDQGQAYFVSHSGATGNLGTLAFQPNGSYTYSVDNSAVQYLGAGETKIETFTVVTADGTSKQVQFVINGVNDAAVIGDPASTSVKEDRFVSGTNTLEQSGTLAISDADQGQAKFQVLSVAAGSGTTGSFTLQENGSYKYVVDNGAIQYLRVNQTLVDTFTVKAFDGTTKVLTFTIIGTNDTPQIMPVDIVGSVIENDATPILKDGGSVNFMEIDTADVISSSVSLKSTTTTGPAVTAELATALESAVSLAQSGTNDGSIAWNFSLANKLTQFIPEGETITVTYTITVKDDTGTLTDTAKQDITVTITGENQQVFDVSNGSSTYSEPTSTLTSPVLGKSFHYNNFTIDVNGTNNSGQLIQTARGLGVANVVGTKITAPEIGGAQNEGVKITFDAPEDNAVVKLAFFFASGGQDSAVEYAKYAVTYLDGNNVLQTTAYTEIAATAPGKPAYNSADVSLGFYDIKLDTSDIGGKIVSVDIQPVQKAGTTSDFLIRAIELNGAGDDTLNGNAGDNVLAGQAGHDTISGNNGNDVLSGGIGNDTLTGGAGNDTYAFGTTHEGIDTITDFAPGQDKIQVSASGFGGGLVAGGAVTLVQVADWAAASSGAGGYFIYDTAGGDAGTLYFDANGGSGSDAVAFADLANNALIQASDFSVAA